MTIFWIIIILLLTILWFLLLKRKQSATSRRRLPPGPWSLPIIGSLHIFRDSSKRPFEILTELSKQYGKIFGLQMGSIYTVVLIDPALIREALRRDECTGRAPLYLTHGIMGGKGIICAEGPLWRDQRKCAISWLRHLGMVKNPSGKRLQLEERIMRHVEQGIKSISKACQDNGGSVEMDILPTICHNLGNAINDILFGITYPENDETWKYLLHLQIEAIEHIGVAGVVNFLPFLRFLPKNRSIMKFIMDGKEKTHKIYTRIIRNAEAQLQANNYELQEITNILELFLKERHQRTLESSPSSNSDPEFFGDSQLNHLLADIFGAGLDTTMTTIRWTLLYVSLNPVVQQKLRQEFNEVLPLDSPITMEHYESLGYLRSCIAEAQRIRPVVPMGLPHGTTADTELAGYHIPRKSMVLPLQWAMHMNADAWPEPDVYKPERFYDDFAGTSFSSSSRHTHFMPFQVGKRMCLGDDLAKLLLFLITGNLLRRFEMKVDVEDGDGKEDLLRGVDGFTLAPKTHTFKIREVTDGYNNKE